MGEVVLFRQSRPPRIRENEGAAQNLFFTGVRYERMTETPPNNGRPSSNDGLGAKRKRKRG